MFSKDRTDRAGSILKQQSSNLKQPNDSIDEKPVKQLR